MNKSYKITDGNLSHYLWWCIVFILFSVILPYTHHLPYYIPFAFTTAVEFLLIALIFTGIFSRVIAKKLFGSVILRIFKNESAKSGIFIEPKIDQYNSLSLLSYWADVIIVFGALRFLQISEHADFDLFIILNIFWYILIWGYWYRVVENLAKAGFKERPANETELRDVVDKIFEEKSNKLFWYDCFFWGLFSIIPGTPSDGLVINLFIFTAVSLIEDYTTRNNPIEALLADRKRTISIIVIGGICSYLQWEADGITPINRLFSYYNHSQPVHGGLYPLLVYASIIVIAIWRGGERHSNKHNEINELLSLLKSTVHNTKNEAIKLVNHDLNKIYMGLSPDIVVRIENMAMSVIGMWLVVKPEARHEMNIKIAGESERADISKEMIASQLLNIFESALYIKNLPPLERLRAPDKDILSKVNKILGNKEPIAVVNQLINWDSSVATNWIVCKQKKELTRNDSNFVPDAADIGLFRSAVSEMLRNALRHNSESNPYLQLNVSILDSYLMVDVINVCGEKYIWDEFNKLVDDDSNIKKGGGVHSLYGISKALTLKISYFSYADMKVKISLGVKISNG